MKKSILGQTLNALFIFILLLAGGCAQSANKAAPVQTSGISAKNSTFNIGGVNVALPLPTAYTDAPLAVRQALAASFLPPENIFGVYSNAADKAPVRGEGAALLRNRRLFAISARPEFTREAVDVSFYRAMQRDLTRVNGNFSAERIAQFKVLTDNYYARDDAFAHSLGVYESGRGSLSIVRIVRQASSRGAGAVSVYPPGAPGGAATSGVRLALQGWDKDYFSRAYHQVAIQNVLLLNGRFFNIYFFAPLATEADIYSAMRENKEYMQALAASLAGRGRTPEAAGMTAGRGLRAN